MFKNFKHKIIYLSIGLLVGCLFPIQSLFADNPIKLIINGKTINNASPQIISNRTYVPLRVISEELGATVEWDGVNRVVRVNSKVEQKTEQINQNQNQNNNDNVENNNVQPAPKVENPKSVDSNNPPMVDGEIDANNNGTPDWVEQNSNHIFNDERMKEPAAN